MDPAFGGLSVIQSDVGVKGNEKVNKLASMTSIQHILRTDKETARAILDRLCMEDDIG